MSVHVSLSAETRHLIDAAALARMKPGSVLINTSRGPVVDQAALTDALRSGHLWGAGLDVTDPEPMRADDPLVTMPNCLVVPHVASATERTRDRMAEKAARNLLAGLRGEPLPDPVPARPSDRSRRLERAMPPLAIAFALTAALIHATWNLVLAGSEDTNAAHGPRDAGRFARHPAAGAAALAARCGGRAVRRWSRRSWSWSTSGCWRGRIDWPT